MEFNKLKPFTHLLFLLNTILFVGCSTAQDKSTQEFLLLETSSFSEKLYNEENPQLIDVRTKAEFDNGSIPNAVNYDLLDGTFQEKINTLDKTKTVFVFCAKGGRSGKAAKLLKEDGFQSVIDLKGGYTAWVKE